MCKILGISRHHIYYKRLPKIIDHELENQIINIFNKSRKNYGTRKIKAELKNKGYKISRKRIGKIMKKYHLISNYTLKHYKPHKAKSNDEKIENIVNREFDFKDRLEVVVSDLTYVKVAGKWNYLCVLLDLYNREIVGYSTGKNKNSDLIIKAFATIKNPLFDIGIFHTDRGLEFKNKDIDDLLRIFKIQRSLSKKGCPYDNAVSESTFKIIKTEFVFNNKFENEKQLEYEFFDYVNWYNNERLHGSLGYLTPVMYKNLCREKVV